MRILHLRTSTFIGSPEKLILAQIKCLRGKAEFGIAVLPDPSHSFYEEAGKQGVKAYLWPSKRGVPLETVFSLRRILRQEKYRILCSHDYKSNFIGKLACVSIPIRQIAVFHGRTSHDSKIILYEKLDDLILRRVDAVVAVSEATKRRLAFLGSKVHVIHNGVDPEDFKPSTPSSDLRLELGLSEKHFVIGTAGRLSLEKDQDLLIHSFGQVLKSFPLARLIIAGDGPQKSALERQSRSAGLDGKVFFLGYRRDLKSFYEGIDVFVLSSRTEGLPMVLLEAACFRKPAVSTAVGGVPEVIRDGQSGILISPGSVEALADALTYLALNPNVRTLMGEKSREIMDHSFSIRQYSEKFFDLYQECLSEGRKTRS